MSKILGSVTLLLCLVLPSILQANSLFFTVQDYFKKHPEQIERSVGFEKYVRQQSKPIAIDFSKKIKITIIYPGIQISDYWRRSVISFELRLKELKVPYEIEELFSRPGQDIAEQEKQIVNAIANHPDYLIFTLDEQTHRRIIERILAEGRTKVILQNITTPLKAWDIRPPFFYVGFDHLIGAQKLAEYYINKTAGQGQYAVLFFTPGIVSEQRGNSFIDYLTNNSKLKLSQAFYTDGSKESGKKMALQILEKNPDIKFIYACATDIALGALEAVKERKLQGKVLVNGWGGGSSELQSIEQKEMTVTVMRMNDDNGVAMAEAIRFDVTGQRQMIPQVFSGEFALIDQQTPPDEVKKFSDYAFRYSK